MGNTHDQDEIDISSDEEYDSGMDQDEKDEIRKRNRRRRNARKMDDFCRKLKFNANQDFRRAIRPGKDNNRDFLVPINQISPYHDFVISQIARQREVIQNSTKLSIDNNH